MITEILAENVKCGIVEVLGCKTGRIDHGEARVLSINEVLFNQLHALLIVQTFLLVNPFSPELRTRVRTIGIRKEETFYTE
jgi:hypothetical protein